MIRSLSTVIFLNERSSMLEIKRLWLVVIILTRSLMFCCILVESAFFVSVFIERWSAIYSRVASVIQLVDQCVICGIFRPVVLLMLAMVLLCETKSGVAGASVEAFFGVLRLVWTS